MPQISNNNISQLETTCADMRLEAATELNELASWLENEICQALLEGDVARAERLVGPQTRARKHARRFNANIAKGDR